MTDLTPQQILQVRLHDACRYAQLLRQNAGHPEAVIYVIKGIWGDEVANIVESVQDAGYELPKQILEGKPNNMSNCQTQSPGTFSNDTEKRIPKVYNKRRPHEIPEDAVYVGRPSPWGNPYKVSRNKTREQAIREFQTYAELKDFYEKDWLEPLRGKDLVCWCSPLPCHADILLRMANEDIETKRARHTEIGWP